MIPPDPLLRAKVAESSGNGTHGNGSKNTNGSKSNGASRNGSAHRAERGNATVDDSAHAEGAPIEAAAVETTITDTPSARAETAPFDDASPADVHAVDAGTAADAVPEPAVETKSGLPPPSLAPPPLSSPALKSGAAAADTDVVSSRPSVDVSVDEEPQTEAASGPTKAPSRWSLRRLVSKMPTTASNPVAEFAPPSPPDVTVPTVPDGEPPARSSSSPITSPIPVQSLSTGDESAPVEPKPADNSVQASVRTSVRAFVRPSVQPFGLMPEQPPYIRPAPSFDPGLFRSGPVELDPALDPDRPERTPRLKPVHVAAARRRGRPRMRRVTRVVRHVDPWSVFKVALCFSLVLYGVCLTAGVLLWNVAYTTGTIDNVQRFFESFGWDTFRFKGGELYHNAWIAGLFCAIGLTGLIVLAATLFNLITDLVGGIRVTVLEEEVIERDPAERRTLLRRRTRHTTSTVSANGRRDDEESVELYEHLS